MGPLVRTDNSWVVMNRKMVVECKLRLLAGKACTPQRDLCKTTILEIVAFNFIH